MLRLVRTVRATTKEEVDAAFATADQITVEGDDELLTYAVNTRRLVIQRSLRPLTALNTTSVAALFWTTTLVQALQTTSLSAMMGRKEKARSSADPAMA